MLQNIFLERTDGRGTKDNAGRYLEIRIDLEAEGTPSASGKTTVIASTRGNERIPGPGDFRLGLNLYR